MAGSVPAPAVAGFGSREDQGPAVAEAVPRGVGAGRLGVGVGSGALAVGALVGKRVGVAVGDEVDMWVGKEVGAGRGGPVVAVASGAGAVDFFVACGVLARGLGDGVLVVTGVGGVLTVGTGGSMR